MKKHLLLLVFALVASAVQAQNLDPYMFMYHDMTNRPFDIYTSMQQRDGDHIMDISLFEHVGDYYNPLGNMTLKISTDPLSVTDSLFVADTALLPLPFLARDPRGEGNIRVTMEYHEDCDSTFVRISHFPDNDLHTNPEEDVLVPICEGGGDTGKQYALIDSWGDLIVTYYKMPTEETIAEYIVRIGLDGTLKHHALLTENLEAVFRKIIELKKSPLQYYQWDFVSYDPYNDNLAVYVIDSIFHRNTVILNKILSTEVIGEDTTVYDYLKINYDTEVIPAGGNNVLVAAQYIHDTNFLWPRDFGVAVAKYDLRTMQLKDYVVFNDSHWYGSTGSPMGLKMLEDGTVYFMYKEYRCTDNAIMVVKMDVDLNVEWKRFCKTGNIELALPNGIENPIVIVFEDAATGEEKGVALCGFGSKDNNNNFDERVWAYFVLNHDGTVSINEGGIEVRPYLFYPNPTQDQLHLQYSPDVKPARIELYDLQGRLVRSQRHSLKSVEMQGLSAGQYLMKVILEDGKTYADKVVKE